MPEPTAPEIKISKNPEIQTKVEDQKNKLKEKFPEVSEPTVNQIARDKVASNIKLDRQKKQTKEALGFAMIDTLTGLHNRRWFEDEIKTRLAEIKRNPSTDKKPLWLLMFDIDLFKKINTQYGHSGGDLVLKDIASLPFRQEEPIVRLGGEEFVELIDQSITEEQLSLVLQRYRESIIKNTLETLKNKNTIDGTPDEERVKNLTLSFGLAKYEEHDTPESFMRRANMAMMEAKNTGRDKAIIATLSNKENSQEEFEYKNLPIREKTETEELAA